MVEKNINNRKARTFLILVVLGILFLGLSAFFPTLPFERLLLNGGIILLIVLPYSYLAVLFQKKGRLRLISKITLLLGLLVPFYFTISFGIAVYYNFLTSGAISDVVLAIIPFLATVAETALIITFDKGRSSLLHKSVLTILSLVAYGFIVVLSLFLFFLTIVYNG